MDQVLLRRILGTGALVLLIGVSALVLDWRFAPAPGSYDVWAELGRAGSGLGSGSDVKVRGVRIGEVAEVTYDDGIARARLRLDPEPRLPAADHLELVVTAKTFFGEKQVEIFFPKDVFGKEPYLEPGDTVVAARQPTDVSEVLDTLTPFLAAIDGEDLATIFDTLGHQQGEGEFIARNLEVSDELAAFAEETAADNLARLRALSDVAEALTPAAEELARLNRALPEATVVLTERQAEIRSNLDTVSRAARTLSAFLRTERGTIGRFLETSQPIGDVIERQQDEIGSLVAGIALYAETLGAGGLLLDDGTEWAPFRIFIDPGEFDLIGMFCHEAPDFPGCDQFGGDA